MTGSETRPGRQRILDAAAAMFLERGFRETSLRDVAADVGIKAGSLYYHFGSKDEMLAAVFRRGMEIMQAAFDEADLAGSGEPAEQRFHRHVRAHLAALYENGPYTAAHVTSFRLAPPVVRDEILPARDAYEARWTALLERLVADGDLDPAVSIPVLRLTLFGAMNASVEWFDPGRGDLDTVASALARQVWSGVAARPVRPSDVNTHEHPPGAGR